MKKKQLLGALLMFSMLMPAAALAARAVGDETGFRIPDNFEGTEDANSSLILTIINIVNALLAFAGLVAAIFIVIGGVRYITSQGDEDAVAGAKNTILYAAIGIIVILLSAVLVNFVIGTIT